MKKKGHKIFAKVSISIKDKILIIIYPNNPKIS